MTSPGSPPPASFRRQSYADTNGSAVLPKQRTQSPGSSTASLPYRPNLTLSNLFASTSLSGTVRSSGSSTPTRTTESVLGGSTVYSGVEGRTGTSVGTGQAGSPEIRNLIQRAFAPHVGVMASHDTDALLRERGFKAGFIDIIRPYGEQVSGKVTVRDSIGASRIWEDFGIRFVGLKDGLSTARVPSSSRPSFESRGSETNSSSASARTRPSIDVQRVGGDVQQIEQVVERHLNFAELRPSADHEDHEDQESRTELADADKDTIHDRLPEPPTSPFYTLYLRRLLSGLPLAPHETFSHPAACVIATSSRNPSPIEEFKRLYQSTTTGHDRLPQWVNNEYLRYYVLVHDEDNDDISKSVMLYEQMKRNFGLHCHLLRLRSSQCVPSDDDSVRLPITEWMTASEELAAIQSREVSDDEDELTPCLFESDAGAIRSFVRELVTQSIVPNMERLCAQWNETVATRRKGISGRILSVSKRWGFGLPRSTNSPAASTSSSNYDSLQGFYRPDAAESLMRKLGDYAFMLRDFNLAQQTYDVLRSDFEHDKAWKYYAGANEMYLISTMLNSGHPINKRLESIERWLEAAVHSYVHRCNAPYYALRTILLAFEAVKARGSLTVDDASRWASKVMEMNLTGPVGAVLTMERIASCYAQRQGSGVLQYGTRRRKRGVWSLLAADSWSRFGKTVQAERCLVDAMSCFNIDPKQNQASAALKWMVPYMQEIQDSIVATRLEILGPDMVSSELLVDDVEEVEEVSEEFTGRAHRRSIIPVDAGMIASDLTSGSLSPVRTRDDKPVIDEGFE